MLCEFVGVCMCVEFVCVSECVCVCVCVCLCKLWHGCEQVRTAESDEREESKQDEDRTIYLSK